MSLYYVSGPIAGHDDLNIDAFRDASRRLHERGLRAILPHDLPPYNHDGPCPEVYGTAGEDGLHDGGCHLRGDLVVMLQSADGVYVLPGWSRSKGAQIEVLIARLLCMPIECHPDAERGGSAVDALAAVYAELGRQDAKWGQQDHLDGTGRETFPLRRTACNLDLRTGGELASIFRASCQRAFAAGRGTWKDILLEEVAEALAEDDGDALATELIQVAAVATQWAAAIERRTDQ